MSMPRRITSYSAVDPQAASRSTALTRSAGSVALRAAVSTLSLNASSATWCCGGTLFTKSSTCVVSVPRAFVRRMDQRADLPAVREERDADAGLHRIDLRVQQCRAADEAAVRRRRDRDLRRRRLRERKDRRDSKGRRDGKGRQEHE